MKRHRATNPNCRTSAATLRLRLSESFSCCSTIRNWDRGWTTHCAISCFADFRSLLCTRLQETSSISLLSLTEAENRGTGACAFKTANKLLEPTYEAHAAQQ